MRCNVALQKAVTVLGKGGWIPDSIVDPEAYKPPEQEVVVQSLHELALGSDGVERLQEHCPQKALRGNRGLPERRIKI